MKRKGGHLLQLSKSIVMASRITGHSTACSIAFSYLEKTRYQSSV